MTTSLSRRRLLAACTLAAAAAAMSAPPAFAFDWSFGRGEQVKGNGKIKREARQVANFKGVALSLPGQVEVRTGNSEGLTIETDDNLLPLIETVIEDGTLKIRSKKKYNINTRNLKIVVQTRGVDRLSLGGSGNIDADRVQGSDLRFDVGGSGSIKVGKAEGQSVNINLGGSGKLSVLDGAARELNATIGGSGNIDMARVRFDTANVTIAGSGDATIWVNKSLDMTVAGSGDVNYYGDPQVSKTAVGSGSARRLGAAPR
ncbi:hypothetical protein SRABI118_03153 [Massilia sp. Bi118]|uniref:head GIN domain-containing protein n=1 Tax=Massilia sp. Bi118 TaxID=2822346 RepID=UPI001D4FC410|nr:head GIN domain-containing protein [Massilia sp. Bi118]CAH0258560.1 hypothetical protein SRABI118_03153 [Massilia sp. Bi118]